MSLLDSINDASWSMLDWLGDHGLPLGDFFEDHGIPPILFPLIIILIVLLVSYLMLAPAPITEQPGYCGDGTCAANETEAACPEDCHQVSEPTGKTVKVVFDKTPECELKVSVYSGSGMYITSQRDTGLKKELDFAGISADAVYISIEGTRSSPQRTTTISIDNEGPIDITLDKDICKVSASDKRTLRISVKDSLTNAFLNGVKVTIAETKNGHVVDSSVYKDKRLDGQDDFELTQGKTYVVYASRDGYEQYDGSPNPITMSSDRSVSIPMIAIIPQTPNGTHAITSDGEEVLVLSDGTVTDLDGEALYLQDGTLLLLPDGTELVISGGVAVPLPEEETGDLMVCLKSDNGTIINSSVVVLEDSSGGNLGKGNVADDPTGEGCYLFTDLDANTSVVASVPNPPGYCISKSTQPVLIEANQTNSVLITLNCTPQNGYIRVRVLDKDNSTITGDCTITVWDDNDDKIPGTGPAGSLSLGTGGYSEKVRVLAGKKDYVYVRGVPAGYSDYESESIIVEKDEVKDFDVYLNYTPPPVPQQDFHFTGLSYPNEVTAGEDFTISIKEIAYGTTLLTNDTAEMNATFADEECNVDYSGAWVFNCTAPPKGGKKYDFIAMARYGDYGDEKNISITVIEERTGNNLISVLPYSRMKGETPLTLMYLINFRSKPLTELMGYNLTLVYEDSKKAYPGELTDFTYNSQLGVWTLTADVLYKGDYSIKMDLQVFKDNVIYSSSHTLTFESETNSQDLDIQAYSSDDILAPDRPFALEVYLTQKSTGKVLGNLEKGIFEVFYGETANSLDWNPANNRYEAALFAPPGEKCFLPLQFLINGDEVEAGKSPQMYVIDYTTASLGVPCPLKYTESCRDFEDIRKCVYDYKNKNAYYTKEEITTCINAGCTSGVPQQCDSNNKGDFYPDCVLDDRDDSRMELIMQTFTNVQERNRFLDCTDMDNDGDVDEDDATCLSNLASGKKGWYGDVSSSLDEGGCSPPMNGGICTYIDTDAALPGDLSGDDNLDGDDLDKMIVLVDASLEGVTVDEDILELADFDQSGNITSHDLDCLSALWDAIDFREFTKKPVADVLLRGDNADCLNIFKPVCGSAGDLNGDRHLDAIDYVRLWMIVKDILTKTVDGQTIDSDNTPCADYTNNDIIDEYDLTCLSAKLSGNTQMAAVCADCDASLQDEYRFDYEVCRDGWDNDCDGEMDEKTVKYRGESVDACECGEYTPSGMMSMIGGNVDISVNSIERCAKLSDYLSQEYKWYPMATWECTEDRERETLESNEKTYTCLDLNGDGNWQWWNWDGDLPVSFPPNPLPGEPGGFVESASNGVWTSEESSKITCPPNSAISSVDCLGSCGNTGVNTNIISCTKLPEGVTLSDSVANHISGDSVVVAYTTEEGKGLKVYGARIIGGTVVTDGWTGDSKYDHDCSPNFVYGYDSTGHWDGDKFDFKCASISTN